MFDPMQASYVNLMNSTLNYDENAESSRHWLDDHHQHHHYHHHHHHHVDSLLMELYKRIFSAADSAIYFLDLIHLKMYFASYARHYWQNATLSLVHLLRKSSIGTHLRLIAVLVFFLKSFQGSLSKLCLKCPGDLKGNVGLA